MPFFDDAGIAPERHRGLVIGAFAVFGEQVERMVALNVAWAASLFPALLAFAAPGLPNGVRLGLLAVSGLLVVPATAVLYGLAARALDGEQLSVELVRETVRDTAARGMRALAPLAALGFVLAWTAGALRSVRTGVATVEAAPLLPMEMLTGTALLAVGVCATYWGPAFVASPDASAWTVLRRSVSAVWRRPGTSLAVFAVSVGVLAFGVLTVAGAVLAAPMLVALLHTNAYHRVEPATPLPDRGARTSRPTRGWR